MFTLYNVCSVNWGIFSTSGDVQYMGGYHYECGGIPCVHRRNTISMWGVIMSTLGDVHHIRGISWCIWESNLINPFNFYWKPQCTNDIPQCTHDIPMYWTSLNVLMVSPHASWYPQMYWTSPNVFMVSPSPMHSWCPPMYLTPPIYSWYSPSVLKTPRCTEPHIIQGGFMFVSSPQMEIF